jgi:uncharacterized caspase-like protein
MHDFNFIIYQFYYSVLDSCFYIVNKNNEIYRWTPQDNNNPDEVYSEDNLREEETWCIAEDSQGKKLVTSGNDVIVFDRDWKNRIKRYSMSGLVCLASDSRKSARFVNDSLVFAISYDGSIFYRNYITGRDITNTIEKKHIETKMNITLDSVIKKDNHLNLWKNGNKLHYLDLDNKEWIVYDEYRRFDGSDNAINTLYFTCGLEMINLNQIKDSLWVPGLALKTLNGEAILINDRPAPKLNDLNICEFTPVIEPPKQEGNKLRYRIVPRRGGLGNTEIIINGNPTYSYAPNQLERKIEDGKEVFYLNLNTDTIQDYLTAMDGAANPLQIRAGVKGSGIFGRGELIRLSKNTVSTELPRFFGVFVGVNDYGNPNGTNNPNLYRDLTFAGKDADDLANAMVNCTRTLFKDSAFIYRLTGKDEYAPNKDNLQRVLGEIGKRARASDVLYIFFAGHGDLLETTEGAKQIRFVLQNAEKRNLKTYSFGADELTRWCHPSKIKAQKRVFVFDACHSGQFMNETYAAVQGRGDDEGKRIRQLDKLKDKNGMMILAASAENQSAYEDETLNQGVLTYHLLQAIKTQAKDTTLTVKSWFDETIDMVQEYSKQNGQQQDPRSFGDGLFEIGNLSKDVRDAIRIECPKKRVGHCVFTSNAETREVFPGVENKINAYFEKPAQDRNIIYSKKSTRAYRAVGYYILNKKQVEVGYDLYLGDNPEKMSVVLPSRKYKDEQELVSALAASIEMEIEKLDAVWRKQNCNLNK